VGLTCDCDDWDGAGSAYIPPEELTTLRTKKRKRCISCRELINIGAPAYEFQHFRYPKTDIEIKIHGEDNEICLAPRYMCEECGDQYLNLDALGYCVNPYENMLELLTEYSKKHQAVKF
jgi:hypothetical protein